MLVMSLLSYPPPALYRRWDIPPCHSAEYRSDSFNLTPGFMLIALGTQTHERFSLPVQHYRTIGGPPREQCPMFCMPEAWFRLAPSAMLRAGLVWPDRRTEGAMR